MLKWVLVDVGEAFEPSKHFLNGTRLVVARLQNFTSAENIISNNVGGGVFIPQINKIKAYYSHDGSLPISLILSFAIIIDDNQQDATLL
jgi:hypothetical protein